MVANERCTLKCLGLLIVWQKKNLVMVWLLELSRNSIVLVHLISVRLVICLYKTWLGGKKRLTGKGMAFKKQKGGRGPMCVGHGSCWISVVHNKKRGRSNAAIASSAMEGTATSCSSRSLSKADRWADWEASSPCKLRQERQVTAPWTRRVEERQTQPVTTHWRRTSMGSCVS